jgi:hypothetical protein
MLVFPEHRYQRKKIFNVDDYCRAPCYKTFFFRNLLMLAGDLSVCPLQAFPA